MSMRQDEKVEMFKTEDFADCFTDSHAAENANRIITERGVRVSGVLDQQGNWFFNQLNLASHTHQALLVCIEELPKKKCEHEPADGIVHIINSGTEYNPCKRCGVKLKAKWEVADD